MLPKVAGEPFAIHMDDTDNLAELLRSDPGNELFVGYAQGLREKGMLRQALEVCLGGVNANPRQHRGRLLLSRIFFELGYHALAARELLELKGYFPQSGALQDLLARFGESGALSQPVPQVQTLAEHEFSISELEDLEEGKD